VRESFVDIAERPNIHLRRSQHAVGEGIWKI
jgi:hypothetical protein